MEVKVVLEDELALKLKAACFLRGENAYDVAYDIAVAAIAEYTRDILMSNAKDLCPSSCGLLASDPADNRRKFVDWLKSQKTPGRRQPYQSATIAIYASQLNSICQRPGFESLGIQSLFEITDVEEFAEVANKLKAHPSYEDTNAKSHNVVSGALKKYAEYLESIK